MALVEPTPRMVHDLWEELGRPGAEKLRRAMEHRDWDVRKYSVKDLRDGFLKFQTSKQIFAPAPKYRGLVYSTGLDSKWVADVIVNTQMPEVYKGTRWAFALVVQDVFSRYAWAELLREPQDAYEALEEIIHQARRPPEELVTDADNAAFLNPRFREVLRRFSIHHTIREGRNDLATVDRLIRTLKEGMRERAHRLGQWDWASHLQQYVKQYNERAHAQLLGGTPGMLRAPGGDVGRKILYFRREEQEAQAIAHNDAEIRSRIPKLRELGAFRVYKHQDSRLRRRVYEPSWSLELHRVARIEGAYVTDTLGRTYPTKEVLPVPSASEAISGPAQRPVRADHPGREPLRAFADALREKLLGEPDFRMGGRQAMVYLNQLVPDRTLKEAMAEQRLEPTLGRFVEVFGDWFKLVQLRPRVSAVELTPLAVPPEPEVAPEPPLRRLRRLSRAA